MKKLLKDIYNLIFGISITGKHLGRHAITIQYPEQRMDMFDRSRGVVVLLSDKETGELNCTACMLCMRACPTAAIYIDAPRGEDKKRQLKQFDIDFTVCCYCGLCEEACNFDAIKLANKYEFANYSLDDNIWDMNKLQEVGRDVPYEVTRKKKPARPKPKPSAPESKDKKPEAKAEAEKKQETAADTTDEAASRTSPQKKADDRGADKSETGDETATADTSSKNPGSVPDSSESYAAENQGQSDEQDTNSRKEAGGH